MGRRIEKILFAKQFGRNNREGFKSITKKRRFNSWADRYPKSTYHVKDSKKKNILRQNGKIQKIADFQPLL